MRGNRAEGRRAGAASGRRPREDREGALVAQVEDSLAGRRRSGLAPLAPGLECRSDSLVEVGVIAEASRARGDSRLLGRLVHEEDRRVVREDRIGAHLAHAILVPGAIDGDAGAALEEGADEASVVAAEDIDDVDGPVAGDVRGQVLFQAIEHVGEVELTVVLAGLPAVGHQPIAGADGVLAEADPVGGAQGPGAALDGYIGVVRGRQVASEDEIPAPLELAPGEAPSSRGGRCEQGRRPPSSPARRGGDPGRRRPSRRSGGVARGSCGRA